MRHWLIKFAPFRTSWSDIVRAGNFTLRGVRSREARGHLAAMRLGDSVLFYQSQRERNILGVMEVTHEAYPDPTSSDPQWLTCDFAPVQAFAKPVSLAQIKANLLFASLPLVRQPRLAVMPLSREHYAAILELASLAR